MNKPSKNIIGNAALFKVAYELSLRNWNVTITTRSAVGPDLYIHDLNGNSYPIQVKGISNTKDWISAKSAGKGLCKWWIAIRGIGSEGEEAFIQTEQEVIARRNPHGWSEPLPEARNAWHLIGLAPVREDLDAEEA